MRCYNSFQKTAKPKNEHFTQTLLGVSKQQGFIQVEKSEMQPTELAVEAPMGGHSSAASPLRLWSATSVMIGVKMVVRFFSELSRTMLEFYNVTISWTMQAPQKRERGAISASKIINFDNIMYIMIAFEET